MNKSQSNPDERYSRKFTEVKNLDETLSGQEVLIRGRVHNSRSTGKNCFITVREQFSTIQAIVSQSETISKGMVKYAGKIPKESIVDIKATVIVPEKAVESCTQKVELSIKEIWIVNKSVPQLPF